ncbi:hypothetical protein PAAG_08371 [Paracoccidioides lutzii Pb01]|uniref:Uncharacterized protein n=1 Tax=Paracoccidioides lutzii (strain ATCC MYA-826 / Pb01) TaxID=502779 RepID=C1HC80_PARBA|nr:hypothetical protein PAAG_08371 [Paracoccidioides lutzii Pb01]EEH38644.2 hypothetical protein PAAG_08371 [Paracoccidioides lutzii Pb01]
MTIPKFRDSSHPRCPQHSCQRDALRQHTRITSYKKLNRDIPFPPTSTASIDAISPPPPPPSTPQNSATAHHILPIPAFYLHRENGVTVPLIPLDELPSWLRIGREDWYSFEWQRYTTPVNDQSTIWLGEYEVFAVWETGVYELPTSRQVGVQAGGDGAGAGTGGRGEGEEGEEVRVAYHLDGREAYRSGDNTREHNTDAMDDELPDDRGWTPGSTQRIMGGYGTAYDADYEEQVKWDGANREQVTHIVPQAPPLLPECLDSTISSRGGGYGEFSYFDIAPSLASDNYSCYHGDSAFRRPYRDPHPSRRRQLPSPDISRPTSSTSCTSANCHLLHSLESHSATETSLSSLSSSSDFPNALFYTPILPQAPLGLTQSAPGHSGLSVYYGNFQHWLESTESGSEGVHSA